MSEPLEKLLSQLERTTGQSAKFDGRHWHTRCPVHADLGRNLSIHVSSDGRVLMHCKRGCEPARITQAVGVSLDALLTKSAVPQPLVETSYSEISPRGIQMLLSKQEAVVTRLDQCTKAAVRWLWPRRIPLGKLTLLVGDPGLGKSLVALDIAARVSRCQAMPQLEGETPPAETAHPGSVLLLSAEDDAADTIRPRLEALGAELSRIVVLHAIDQTAFGGSETRRVRFSLESNLAALETVMKSQDDCRLVVIDPITAFLGRKNSHLNAEIRALLAPLSELAARRGVAMLAINHLNKKRGGPSIYRSMGSLAFAAVARSVLAVLADPHDAAARVLVPVKSNVAARVDGFGFRVAPAAQDGSAGDGADGDTSPEPRMPIVRWGTTPIRLTADEILHAAAQNAGIGPAIDEATEWLASVLAAGSQAAVELKSKAKADGIHERTLLRAKGRLRVVTSREGFGLGGSWLWSLPKA